MKSDKNAGNSLGARSQAAMGMDAGKSTGASAVAELNRQHPNVGIRPGAMMDPTKMKDSRNVRNKGLPMAPARR